MKSDLLNPKWLEEYYTTISEINPDVNLFDVFLSTLIYTVDPTGKVSPMTTVHSVLGDYEFKSQKEAEIILNKHVIFINSIISFLEVYETTGEPDKRIKLTDKIFKNICGIYKNDYSLLFDTLIDNCESLKANIWRFYNIPKNATEKQYNEILSTEFSENAAMGFTAFFCLLQLATEYDEFNKAHLKNLYEIFLDMILVLNLHRKNNFSKNMVRPVTDNAVKDIGRNDPCPCGSEKKYKKCCLLKIN